MISVVMWCLGEVGGNLLGVLGRGGVGLIFSD